MKILYIEDNYLNFRLVQKMLKGKYDLFGAITGEEGLNQLDKLMPDLILLDINLPDFDGYVLQEAIRKDTRFDHIPIIALTANAMFGDRERIMAAGFDAYLAKPITRIEITNMIGQCLSASTSE
ncbi:MAG: response regulator [Chloroflexota bacterium]